MPLKLYERPNGVFHIRGTVQGRRVDESSRTRNRAEAEQIRARLEADLFKRAVYGDSAVATFAEAALGYMKAGGSPDHLTGILAKIGNHKLRDVTQSVVDDLAAGRTAKPATLIRQIYTPVIAVMTYAAEQRLCDPVRFRKPKVASGRTEYLTPAEAEAWIAALPPHLAHLVTFYLGTGCRATEALELDWKDVSPKGERVTLWVTKADYPRGVDLQDRVRAVLPDRGKEHVFRNSRGEPWHAYDAINLMLKKIRARRVEAIKAGSKLPPLAPAHCHLFRHTWATWAYACTRDLTFVMQSGGWRSLAMLARYTHAASPDLAREVLDHGWEFGGREIYRSGRKPRKPKNNNGLPP